MSVAVTVDRLEVRGGTYADSVTLMHVSRRVSEADGVVEALVAMATELNVELIAEMGFRTLPDCSANDLLVAVRARDDDAAASAMALASLLLANPVKRVDAEGAAVRLPRTTGAAVRGSDANLALISVPGPHAFTEAMDAIESGANVMVFSDNVSVVHEIALKEAAAARGVLVMGPDCGTAIVGGVALGFANTVQRGPVGIVAASGTGAQQVIALLDAAGVGVSAVLGVGGRDLSAAVGARSTRAALALLDADPRTELIVLVSKPPAADVLRNVEAAVRNIRTPVQRAVLGRGEPDLSAAVEAALRRLDRPIPKWPSWLTEQKASRRGALRGLFCGGTLCEEAMLIASAALGEVRSNIPLRPDWALGNDLHASGHALVDFGDDALTRGRAHPMIDPTIRLQHLQRAIDDGATGVVLLDVLLGHGSPADPVGDLLPLVRRSRVPVVVTIIGTRGDAQGLEASAVRLRDAGASVFGSNAAATRHALTLLGVAS